MDTSTPFGSSPAAPSGVNALALELASARVAASLEFPISQQRPSEIPPAQHPRKNDDMALLRLTPANLTYVEHSLSSLLPDVDPAHIVEALASALGETSAATLRTRLAAQTEQEVLELDGSLWVQCLAELGYSDMTDSPLKSAVRDPELPDPCWREFNKSDTDGSARWFDECCRENIPYISIQRARKYADLSWDCISTSCRNFDQLEGKGTRDVLKILFTTFQRFAKNDPNKSIFNGAAFVGKMKGLLPSTAYDIADAAFVALFLATRAQSARSPAPV